MDPHSQTQLNKFSTIFSLEGKIALVTGGSRGLGLHAASGLLQAGCSKVYFTSRSESRGMEAAAALNALQEKPPSSLAVPIAADCSSAKGIEKLVAEVSQTTDHIDILLVNAATTWHEKFDSYPESAFSNVLDVNLKSVFYLVQKTISLLEKNATIDEPSRVISHASLAGLVVPNLGDDANFAYAASKGGLIHMMKHLAVDLGPRHITFNSICPGFFHTDMTAGYIEKLGGTAAIAGTIPNQRVGTPEDIAGLVVFLASRAGSHVNGAAIPLDGGMMLGKANV